MFIEKMLKLKKLNVNLNNIQILEMLIFLLILIFVDVVNSKEKSVRGWIYKRNIIFRWSFYLISIFEVLIFGIWGPSYSERAFIYFNFLNIYC